MSSGFVSAGTNEEPVERDDAWIRAQKELEEERRLKAEAGQQKDGKSLFEVLQQNKMAKQEQFEEKIRLKNQFRALDEDEIDFLDSVLESTRAQEEAVKKDTADQLEVFRKQREEAEKAMLGSTASDVTPAPAEEEDWAIPARKRRRDKGKDALIPGKKRKASLTESGVATAKNEVAATKATSTPVTNTYSPTTAVNAVKGVSETKALSSIPETTTTDTKQPAKPAPAALGLVGYGSDSDSE
ncbi:Putative Podospora anserina S mat genomic DNA chromosome 6, supercontig 4 [Penicillium brasilianum]|uniref:Putative Podospora anserina S mat genomic DNA chromosome 6, supercontig 4 n=1 Tax=Penicillium brasilianum TaxID=104259 RepID=A0A0F7TQI9_PENBI|nr:Putative Podospora anserina S mat genomic DNA chromosome 6, supercontig 4 [Penicillium brasilianum]